MKWILALCTGLTLFYITVYPMLAVQIYTPSWYQLGCEWHGRCEQLGEDKTNQAITELTGFWQHQGELSAIWSDKERRHLAEVRPMFDALFFAFLAALLLAFFLFKRERIRKPALVNALLVLSLLLILPFFKYFWIEIFHPLLFSNLDWSNKRHEISWYLMPKPLFMLSLGTLVIWTCLVNLSIWWWAKEKGRE